MKQQVNIFWFRRDLRLNDNAGLFHALASGLPVVPVFIFDSNILDQLPSKTDCRVAFIHTALESLQASVLRLGGTLHVLSTNPKHAFEELLQRYSIKSVFTNHDYEPYAISRDVDIFSFLQEKGIGFHSYKDQVIFEKNEIVRDNQQPYLVFTPYGKQWKQRLSATDIRQFQPEKYFSNFYQQSEIKIPTLDQLGFEPSKQLLPPAVIDASLIMHYDKTRNSPAFQGTSRLGIHLRFGTISIRELVTVAQKESESFLNELIWREFFQMILYHFPSLAMGASFKKEFDAFPWRNNEAEFEAWCMGQTGYPIVDAGMRQLNETGFMHNRVRMITASFLCKHLLIDWRWGEAYFAEKLLDFELASNNGNWQWVAGCGVDAAPYFRIFNPILQAKKFDPGNEYVKQWVPEWNTNAYPQPIIQHEFARNRALAAYKDLRNSSRNIGSLR